MKPVLQFTVLFLYKRSGKRHSIWPYR